MPAVGLTLFGGFPTRQVGGSIPLLPSFRRKRRKPCGFLLSRWGYFFVSVSADGSGGVPLPSPGGEGGLRRLTQAGGRMRWGIVPCCVGTKVQLVGTPPHPPPAGAPSQQGEGFAGELGCRVLASVSAGGPLPSPGGEGGLRRLTQAGGRMRWGSSLAALEWQCCLSGRHLIRPLRGHLPLKGKALRELSCRRRRLRRLRSGAGR